MMNWAWVLVGQKNFNLKVGQREFGPPGPKQ